MDVRVVGIHGDLVLGCITDEPLVVREGDIGWGGAVALVVGDNFNAVVLPYTDAAVSTRSTFAWEMFRDGTHE